MPAWIWKLVGLLYQFVHPQANLMGQNKNLRTILSYILFDLGFTENKWNYSTATTGKKTCSAINKGMMDRVYHGVLIILVFYYIV